MVLSRSKLKGKRKEEAMAEAASLGNPSAVSAAEAVKDALAAGKNAKNKKRKKNAVDAVENVVELGQGAAEGSENKKDAVDAVETVVEFGKGAAVEGSVKKETKKQEKKKGTGFADAAETVVEFGEGAAVEGSVKKKKKKQEKKNGNGFADAEEEMTEFNGGGVQMEEVPVSNKKKTKGDKKTKAAQNVYGSHGADGGLSASCTSRVENGVENGKMQVDDRTGEGAGDDSATAQRPVMEEKDSGGIAVEGAVSVREKKGKKKKGGKDRWGAKISDNHTYEEGENHAADAAVPQIQPSVSTTEELFHPKKVFVGGMPYSSSEEDIHYYFSECGIISELDCVIFPDTGKFRGIAFITFETEDGAAKALEYDGADMGGRFLKIEKCRSKPRAGTKDSVLGEVQKTEGCTSAYIGNLAWNVTEDAIESFLKTSYSSSKIDAIRLAYDKHTGEFKGYGHVDFGDDESLDAAVKLNQKQLMGRALKIAYSVPPKTDFQDTDKSESKATVCYNCGEEGHKSFLCPKKSMK